MTRGLQVGYQELDKHSQLSPSFSGNQIYQASKRVYMLDDWADIPSAIPQALGYPTRSGAGSLSRYLPHQDALLPYLVATSYETRNIGFAVSFEQDGGPGNAYQKAELSLGFEKPMYFLLEDSELETADTANYHGLGPRWAPEIDRFVEYNEIPEGSYITPPAVAGMLAWSPGQTGLGSNQENQPFPQSVSTILGEANITLRWRFIPDDALPLSTIYRCLGRVNQTVFGSKDDARLSFAPWSMLFLGGAFNRIILPNGDFGWDVEYLFKFSGEQKRWNYYLNPRANTAGFFEVSRLPTADGGQTFSGPAVFFDPGSTGATQAATLNNLTYNIDNLNDLFVIA